MTLVGLNRCAPRRRLPTCTGTRGLRRDGKGHCAARLSSPPPRPWGLHLHHGGVSWCSMTDGQAHGAKDARANPIRVSVSFNAADYAEIKEIAQAKRVSAAWVVREAVTSYLTSRTPLFTRDGSSAGR